MIWFAAGGEDFGSFVAKVRIGSCGSLASHHDILKHED